MKPNGWIGWALVCMLLPLGAMAQQPTEAELELYELIMSYRAEHGLPRIPLSPSLTLVAQTHVRDLMDHRPDQGDCNMHSWSDAGTWSPCCYTDDHAESQCMWDKPRELTDYPGDGFEISYGAWGMPADPAGALAGWQSSPPHRDVILNAGMWSDAWQAVGIGIAGGYASVWFGVEAE